MTNDWRRSGTTVYLVDSKGFERGREIMCNRYTIQISGDHKLTDNTDVEALAARLVELLNKD